MDRFNGHRRARTSIITPYRLTVRDGLPGMKKPGLAGLAFASLSGGYPLP